MIYTCKRCGFPNELTKRSNQTNKYLHVILKILGDHLGYEIDEIKTLMKYHFKYYTELTNKETGETVLVYTETSKMDSKTCAEFIDKIIRFAAEHGCVIDDPETYYSK